MRVPRKLFALLAAASIATVEGCGFALGNPEDDGGKTTLVVRNHGVSEMDVYAAPADGPPVLLGFAPGRATTWFTLPPSVVGSGTVRLSADAADGHGIARSDTVAVRAGDRITFTVERALALRGVTVR
jgi:hypothetical protein